MSKLNNCIEECMHIVKSAIKNKGAETINDICIERGRGRNYVSNRIWTLKKKINTKIITK